jgi:hypothetical protein
MLTHADADRYLKIYVPQLPYLADHLRRIPLRFLAPTQVCIRQHMSAYASIRMQLPYLADHLRRIPLRIPLRLLRSADVC